MPNDYRALRDGTGNVALTSITANAGADGTINPGTPLLRGGNPRLEYVIWDELVAGTPILQVTLQSTDLPDGKTGLDFGAAVAPDFVAKYVGMDWHDAQVFPQYKQTVAAAIIAGMMWGYESSPVPLADGGAFVMGYDQRGKPATYNITGAAKVAGTWGEDSFSPNTMPKGRYAVLGASVTAITTRAHLRLSHPQWGSLRPGFPVFNAATGARTANELDLPGPFTSDAVGYQFCELSEDLGYACCPVFEAGTPGASGLAVQMLCGTADTPKITLNMLKL